MITWTWSKDQADRSLNNIVKYDQLLDSIGGSKWSSVSKEGDSSSGGPLAYGFGITSKLSNIIKSLTSHGYKVSNLISDYHKGIKEYQDQIDELHGRNLDEPYYKSDEFTVRDCIAHCSEHIADYKLKIGDNKILLLVTNANGGMEGQISDKAGDCLNHGRLTGMRQVGSLIKDWWD